MLTIPELKEIIPQLQTMLLNSNLDDIQLAGGIIADLPEHYKAILFSCEPNKCNVCNKYGLLGKEAYMKWLKYKAIVNLMNRSGKTFSEARKILYFYDSISDKF